MVMTFDVQVVDYAAFVASGRSVCNIGAPEDPDSTAAFVRNSSPWVVILIDLSAVCPPAGWQTKQLTTQLYIIICTYTIL